MYLSESNKSCKKFILGVSVCRVADPDPVFKFLWIRIWILNFSGSGSGFQISLDPDPVSAQMEQKKCRKVSKSDLSEENLKFMTKDRQKMKKATIFY